MTIAEQVEACRAGTHPRLVARMDSGWAVMGESQVLPGYCLLLADPVVASLNELDEGGRAAFLRDMAALGDSVLVACEPAPRRVNYEMLGNLDPTLHAHVVPRYEAEPENVRTKAIWLYPEQVWNDPERAFDARRHGALREAIAGALARAGRARKADLDPAWQAAASFAARAHEGHLRKDGKTPYASHPFRVALTVRDLFGCADRAAIVAAILHDTVEDTGTDYDEIEESFGAEVAGLVAALSKDMRLPEEQRERAYDEALAAADWRARLIKVADVFDNLSDVSEGDRKAQRKLAARAERAIALARPDCKSYGAAARAVSLLERLLKRSVG